MSVKLLKSDSGYGLLLSLTHLLCSATPGLTFAIDCGFDPAHSAWQTGASKLMMNSLSSTGMLMWGRSKERGGYMPLEGLLALGTYLVWNWIPDSSEREQTHLKTLLACLLWLQPFHHLSMTPMLSTYVITLSSSTCHPQAMIRAWSLKPTASAQLIFLPSHFHPGMSLQALHLPSMTMAMPTNELVSEKALISWRV